jgi:alanyl-tRNA synthetase
MTTQMTRYFCHEQPDTLILETRVVNARPGAVLLERSPFHPGGGGQLADRGVLRWSGGEVSVAGIEATPRASGICSAIRWWSWREPWKPWWIRPSAR